ncbi:MAG: hypothetical protein OXN17_01600 [Candidatus Poribacteria bacterium]|nr:hypothetical protein [Candidatus Poribacteria bacterium]MDE0504344.1 hypothetical protein [Candidatus Poribacteria bacterium]
MKLVPMIWLVIIQLLLLCPCQIAQSGTWRDDFEDKATDEWTIYNLDRRVEKWWIEDGEAVGEIFHPGYMSLWLTGELSWREYSVSCRAKLVEEKNDPATIGLTLHDRGEEDTRYLFFVEITLGIVRIIKATPNGWFIRHFPFVTEIDTWYVLKATINGEFMEFQVDDEVFVSRDLDPLKGGQAGLVVSDARAHFDDIEISGSNIKNGGPGRPRSVDEGRKLPTIWAKIKSNASAN